MILIVSITKLITLFSIIVLIFAVKQPCFSNPVQNYYIKLPKHGSEEEKCKKVRFFSGYGTKKTQLTFLIVSQLARQFGTLAYQIILSLSLD